MGSKKRIVLASLVSLVMVLAFVVGLLPTQMEGSGGSAKAAPGAASIAISADGTTPVGATYAIPVGGEQGFSALSLVGGATQELLANGQAEWSLVTDGAAVLSAPAGKTVATVKALAAGEAALYVATASGLVDVVELQLYELKARPEKVLSSIEITSPVDGAMIVIPQGATNVPLGVTSETNSPGETAFVEYDFDTATQQYTRDTPPYAISIPDITALVTKEVTAIAHPVALGKAASIYDTNAFNIVESAADQNFDGIPDDPFSLELLPGDQWRAQVNNLSKNGLLDVNRQVAASSMIYGQPAKVIDFDAGGTELTIADPSDPEQDRFVTVTVPGGLIGPNQIGMLLVAAANSSTELLGAAEAGYLDTEPAGGLVTEGQYVSISILVKDLPVKGVNGGDYAPLDETLLADNPVTIFMGGMPVTSADNVNFFVHPAVAVDTDPSAGVNTEIRVDETGTWIKPGTGTLVSTGHMFAQLRSLGVVAPFNTPGALKILSVTNSSSTANAGQAKAYSVGGETLDIAFESLPAGTPVVTIGGQPATVVPGKILPVITVVVPDAEALATPAAASQVDVMVEVDGDSDVLENGLTYVGPAVTSITPNSGPAAGGTDVVIVGEGFGSAVSVQVGDAPLANAVVSNNGTQIDGTTTPGTAGTVDVVVQDTNNYQGTLQAGYTYVPGSVTEPVLASVTPDSVLTDGGYKITITGSDFVDPSVLGNTLEVFFTAAKGYVDPNVDVPATSVSFTSATEIEAVTPPHVAGDFDVYVVVGVGGVEAVSNALDFAFIEKTGGVDITSVVPAEGPLAGGNQVTINGTGLPVVVAGKKIDKGVVIETGHVLRLDDKTIPFDQNAVSIDMSLFKGTGTVTTNGPAAISGTITYNPSILTFVQVTPSANLTTWYAKDLTINETSPGTLNFVIFGLNQREITTVDNQRGGASTGASENPFILGTLDFTVVDHAPTTTALELSNVTMSDKLGSGLTDSASQDGSVTIEPEPVEPELPLVFFGTRQATVLSSNGTQVVAIVPEGVAPGSVDVRVVDPVDPNPATNFDILRDGYTYIAGPSILAVSPNQFWLFGGVVAHIQGGGFDSNAQVFFGIAPDGSIPNPPVAAEFAPGFTQTANDLYVIVPPLENIGTASSLAVDVLVKNGDGQSVLSEEAATYVHYELNGDVRTTAFFFPSSTGVVNREVYLNTGTLPSATALLDIPALTQGDVAKGNTGALLTNMTYAIARATKNKTLLQTDELPGNALTNGWEFDLHLYNSEPPFAEFSVVFNTAATPARFAQLSFPTDGTGLTSTEVQSGQVSLFSVASDLAYQTNLVAGSENHGYTADPDDSKYESTLKTGEFTVVGGNVTRADARIYNIESAYSLRTNLNPASVARAQTETVGESGPNAGGTRVEIIGQGLFWVDQIYFGSGPDLTDPTQYSVVNRSAFVSIDDFRIVVDTPKAPTTQGGTVDIVLTWPAQPAKAANGPLLRLSNVFTYDAATNGGGGGLGSLLLGLIAALFGLFAGGGGDSGGGPCFIATAAYGTPMADQIETLRMFRDTFLLSNPVGTAFADMYYNVSPAIADVVAKYPALAAVVRIVLMPVILVAKVALALPAASVAVSLMGFAALALARIRRRKA